jgi:peroxiredoxin
VEEEMAALGSGKKAPQIKLPQVQGGEFWLDQALQKGPVVVVFFKISCPVCQFALPYLERIHQAAKGKNVSIIGVSQNSLKDTQFFDKQYGINFPVALDDPKHYAVSNAYGITNVPTIFYIGQDGTIEVSSVGWAKSDVLEIARRVSELVKMPEIPVIRPGEDVPAFRGG